MISSVVGLKLASLQIRVLTDLHGYIALNWTIELLSDVLLCELLHVVV